MSIERRDICVFEKIKDNKSKKEAGWLECLAELHSSFSEDGNMPKFFHDHTQPARCPFCGAEILRPVELQGGQWYDFAGGFCDCGAVFAHDPTARNGGAAFLQALVMATDGDMDRAMSLSEGEDYDCGYVQKYNVELHRLEPNSFGTLYFIRLRGEAGS